MRIKTIKNLIIVSLLFGIVGFVDYQLIEDVHLWVGGITNADGEDILQGNADDGWIIMPGHEDEAQQWIEDTEKILSGEYVQDAMTGELVKNDLVKNAKETTPSAPNGNKQFDEIDSLPVGDDYNNATLELKQKDEAAFDKYLDYQYEKSLTCEHDYVLVNRNEPTCTEYGSVGYECSKCHTLKTDALEPGHRFKIVEEKVATCTENGYTKSACEVCGEELLEDEVEATGHTEVKEETPATLFKAGSCVTSCSTCGAILVNEIIPQIIPVWAMIIGGILIAGIVIFVVLISKKKQ